jgi:hypothetical protein
MWTCKMPADLFKMLDPFDLVWTWMFSKDNAIELHYAMFILRITLMSFATISLFLMAPSRCAILQEPTGCQYSSLFFTFSDWEVVYWEIEYFIDIRQDMISCKIELYCQHICRGVMCVPSPHQSLDGSSAIVILLVGMWILRYKIYSYLNKFQN